MRTKRLLSHLIYRVCEHAGFNHTAKIALAYEQVSLTETHARVRGTTGGRQAESATEPQSLPLISFDPICKALSEGLKYIYIVLLKSQGEG